MVVRVISIIGSSMRWWPWTRRSPRRRRRGAARHHAHEVEQGVPEVESAPLVTAPRTRVKSTTAVPSLRRLSPSTRMARRLGAPRLLKRPDHGDGVGGREERREDRAVGEVKSRRNAAR
jgi:hypothetical protein